MRLTASRPRRAVERRFPTPRPWRSTASRRRKGCIQIPSSWTATATIGSTGRLLSSSPPTHRKVATVGDPRRPSL
eukprot:1679796-Prymnesium_polylepis.1